MNRHIYIFHFTRFFFIFIYWKSVVLSFMASIKFVSGADGFDFKSIYCCQICIYNNINCIAYYKLMFIINSTIFAQWLQKHNDSLFKWNLYWADSFLLNKMTKSAKYVIYRKTNVINHILCSIWISYKIFLSFHRLFFYFIYSFLFQLQTKWISLRLKLKTFMFIKPDSFLFIPQKNKCKTYWKE